VLFFVVQCLLLLVLNDSLLLFFFFFHVFVVNDNGRPTKTTKDTCNDTSINDCQHAQTPDRTSSPFQNHLLLATPVAIVAQ
jgi:hypothetical protein